ncbi:MAG TPA: ATP-binding protein, partial [Longimicrobiaceae bacterium]|nr:ATP-binding protein [Longimicrobiaceae bacterium]
MFVGRTRELGVLQAEFDHPRPSLTILYGRRRVGKSTLLREAVKQRPHVFYQATRVADTDAQTLFRDEIGRALGSDPILEGLSGWESLFAYLYRAAATKVGEKGEGLVVVIDEFPYLCEDNRALPSILQKVWDELRRGDVPFKLVLCGSHVAFMEDLLAEKNP